MRQSTKPNKATCAWGSKAPSILLSSKAREKQQQNMSSVKQQEQSSLDQTQQRESETPQSKPSTTDRVVDSEYKRRWLTRDPPNMHFSF